jgi:hypothetical protein
MRKVLIILFFVAVIGLIAFFFFQNPEVFRKIYLWLIGLFGILTWPFRKLWNWMNGEDELDKIAEDNKRLKQELEEINIALARAKKTLEEERSKNKIRMEELAAKISREDQTGKVIAKELQDLKGQTDIEFKESLKPEERKKIQEDMWKEVDFGL